MPAVSSPSTTSHDDIAQSLQGWIGRSLIAEDEVSLPAVQRIAATFDIDPKDFQKGSALPPHWYSVFCTLNARQSQIGHDGHPRKGDFLPPIPLPRRMFVGRSVTFPGVLRVGDMLIKRSEVTSITQKSGRSGRLVFLGMRHTFEVDGQAVVIDEVDAVYRDAPTTPVAPPISQAHKPTLEPAWSQSRVMDPVLLFRYSALTWNAHRIHYDAQYARDVEGYPACVMNGALTLHLMVEEALRHTPTRVLASLKTRMVSPLFVGGTIVLCGSALQGDRLAAWAQDDSGTLAATADLEFVRL
jgi:3-methylfumaryl-CoA hydratase